MYFLNYVDRNAIAQARLNDLEEDLGLKGSDFNTAVSMYGPSSPSHRILNVELTLCCLVFSSATSSCRSPATCSSPASSPAST